MPAQSPTEDDFQAYVESPSPETLGAVLHGRSMSELRTGLLGAYRSNPHWRIAQHLSLAWLNKLGSSDMPPDLVRSAYFAVRACELSGEDPRAVMVRAMVYWERRLTYLVLLDATSVETRAKELEDVRQAELIVRQVRELRVCALAYEGRCTEALLVLNELKRAHGMIGADAVLQTFVATMAGDPRVEYESACLASSCRQLLGTRHGARLEAVHRAALLRVLEARSQ